MKAIIWTRYGIPEVLKLQDIDKPKPKDNEILLKISATSVTMGDCEMRELRLSPALAFFMRIYNGIRKPKRIMILGQDFAGEIEAVGTNVSRFEVGDHIFGSTGFKMGAYAEYVCLPEDGEFALKPANITFEEAAAIPLGGLNAIYFLKKANIKEGYEVLINGAGGSIGTFAIQIAKLSGAIVTGVDSPNKLDMLHSIGADQVIDYTQEDFTKNNKSYDVILDLVRKSSYSGCVRSLKKNGTYLLANHGMFRRIRGSFKSMVSSKKIIGGAVMEGTEYLKDLKKLIEEGKIKPVIDKRFSLEQIVEAHEYVETGQKKGNVVITI